MAKVKIKKYKGQYYRHQFYVNGRESRQEILFPKPTTEKQFITCRNKIDSMVQSVRFGLPFEQDVQQWLIGLDDKMRVKLKKVGLINITDERKDMQTLGGFCEWYYQELGHSKEQLDKLRPVIGRLKTYFGKDKLLSSLTQGECIAFSKKYLSKQHSYFCSFGNKTVKSKNGISAVTTRPKHIQQCAAIFDCAFDNEIIAKRNPFKIRKGQKCPWLSQAQKTPPFVEVPLDVCEWVKNELENDDWRFRFDLVRIMGLRPSELNSLRWSEVNWERRTFTVHCQKTKHIDGKEIRFPVILPEIYKAFEDAWDASNGQDNILEPHSIKHMREVLERAIKRAGVPQWPKIHQMLRRNAVTDAHTKHNLPSHVMNDWFGHDEKTSKKSYRATTSQDIAMIWPNVVGVPHLVPQQAEKQASTEEQTKTTQSRKGQKNKQEPARRGRNWQPQVYDNRPGRTRTADQGIMSPLL